MAILAPNSMSAILSLMWAGKGVVDARNEQN
jgi:hypothetical protein